MKYIIIDNFNGSINILSEDDDSGEPKVFESAKEAQEYCNNEAQDGQVIPLNIDLLSLFREVSGIIDHALFELGEPNEDKDTKYAQSVENRVNEIIDGYYPKEI